MNIKLKKISKNMWEKFELDDGLFIWRRDDGIWFYEDLEDTKKDMESMRYISGDKRLYKIDVGGHIWTQFFAKNKNPILILEELYKGITNNN